jgi:hypothetical protein
VSQHVRADELPNVRSTAVRGARTSRDARPRPAPFSPEQLDRLTDEEKEAIAAKIKARGKRRGPAPTGGE